MVSILKIGATCLLIWGTSAEVLHARVHFFWLSDEVRRIERPAKIGAWWWFERTLNDWLVQNREGAWALKGAASRPQLDRGVGQRPFWWHSGGSRPAGTNFAPTSPTSGTGQEGSGMDGGAQTNGVVVVPLPSSFNCFVAGLACLVAYRGLNRRGRRA